MAAVEALSGALAEALRRGRERFNARFAQARALGKPVDAGAFGQLLRDGVAPLVEAVGRVQRERLRADRWLTPERAAAPPARRELRIVRAVSGFRGFGGVFLTPPRVSSVDGTLIASDRESSWAIIADALGTSLQRCVAPGFSR